VAVSEIEALLARIAGGERTAFRSFYALTSARLFGVCLGVLGDRPRAEEALQQVYLRIWEQADRYRVTGQEPMVWLVTLARDAAIDCKRREARRPADAAPVDLDDLLPDTGPGDRTPDAGPLRLACRMVLPPDLTAMLRRAYARGESYETLARDAGVSRDTARQLMRRGLKSLRAELDR